MYIQHMESERSINTDGIKHVPIIEFLIMVYDLHTQFSFMTSDFIISPTNGIVIENRNGYPFMLS